MDHAFAFMNTWAVSLAIISALSACGTGPDIHEDYPGAQPDSRTRSSGAEIEAASPFALDDTPDTHHDAPSEISPSSTPALDGPPYPIVLHHGFSGWKDIKAIGLDYFYGVAVYLREHGSSDVYFPEVAPYQSTEYRASELAERIDDILRQTGKAKVNIIAHSQAGLDSRYAISTLGYGDRIASLTSVGTPHRGTVVADMFFDLLPQATDALLDAGANIIGRVLGDIKNDNSLRQALISLSEKGADDFNQQNINDPRVAYFSYAARSSDATGQSECAGSWYPNDSNIDHIHPILRITAPWLNKQGRFPGANDGMTAVRSARWGTFMGCVPADHFDLIGQIKKDSPSPESGFDHKAFYLKIIQDLRERGY